MNYAQAIPDLAQSFTHINILGAGWLITAAIIFLTLLLITRDPKTWSKAALPVAIGWHISGLKIPLPVLLIIGILWAVSILGDDIIGQLLSTKTDPVKESIKKAAGRKLFKGLMSKPKTKTFKEDISGKTITKKIQSELPPETLKKLMK